MTALTPPPSSRALRVLLAVAIPAAAAREEAPPGMVHITGAQFVMGAEPDAQKLRDDLEQQGVEVQEFWLDATAVTNEAFRGFRKATGYKTEAEKFGWSFVLEMQATDEAKARTNATVKEAPHWLAVPGAWWRYPQGPGSGIADRLDYPVVHISFNDAKEYCKWAGKRLPTETEWESAARRPYASLTSSQKAYPWGDERPSNDSEWRLNLWQGAFPHSDAALDGYAGLAPARAYQPSKVGLYNMLGNVWEWTGTWYAKSSGQRVLRGGSYVDSPDGSHNHMVTCATRMGNTEDSSGDNMGFRCAKAVEGAPKLSPRGYQYSQVKKKRPPPGVGDPLKDGGKAAQELVQAIAAKEGAEGLQKYMDRMGMGADVMMAGDAQKKTEERKRRMMEQAEAAAKAAADAHSFDDLRDEDIDKTEL